MTRRGRPLRCQTKNKINNITNTNRLKCEMKKICKSHFVLPSLVADCPQCEQLIKQLKKQDGTIVQDKLKPFVHNYAKLFCNESILKKIMQQGLPTKGNQVAAKVLKSKKHSSYERVESRRDECKLKNSVFLDLQKTIRSLIKSDGSLGRCCDMKFANKYSDEVKSKKNKNLTKNPKKINSRKITQENPKKLQELGEDNRHNQEKRRTPKKLNENDPKVAENVQINENKCCQDDAKSRVAEKTIPELSYDENILTSESEITSTSLVQLWSRSTRLDITSEETFKSKDVIPDDKGKGRKYENKISGRKKVGKDTIIEVDRKTEVKERKKVLSLTKQVKKDDTLRNASPYKMKVFKWQENECIDKNQESRGYQWKILGLDNAQKRPAVHGKCDSRNINDNVETRKAGASTMNEKPMWLNLYNSPSNNPNISSDYQKNRCTPISREVEWKSFKYRPSTYLPKLHDQWSSTLPNYYLNQRNHYAGPLYTNHQGYFAVPNYQPNHENYISSGQTFEFCRSTLNSSKKGISPLQVYKGSKDLDARNIKLNDFTNQRFSNNIEYSPLDRTRFFENDSRINLLMNWKYLPSTNYSDIFIIPSNKEKMKNLYVGKNESKITALNTRSYLKLKTKKRKSFFKPYQPYSLRSDGFLKGKYNHGQSNTQTSNISHILRKYVGSEQMQNFKTRKEELERFNKSYVQSSTMNALTRNSILVDKEDVTGQYKNIQTMNGKAYHGIHNTANIKDKVTFENLWYEKEFKTKLKSNAPKFDEINKIENMKHCNVAHYDDAKIRDIQKMYDLPISNKKNKIENQKPFNVSVFDKNIREDQKLYNACVFGEKNKGQNQKLCNAPVFDETFIKENKKQYNVAVFVKKSRKNHESLNAPEKNIRENKKLYNGHKKNERETGEIDKDMDPLKSTSCQHQTWRKYLEVIQANKVNIWQIERVPQPLEPLLCKIIPLESLSEVKVPGHYCNLKKRSQEELQDILKKYK